MLDAPERRPEPRKPVIRKSPYAYLDNIDPTKEVPKKTAREYYDRLEGLAEKVEELKNGGIDLRRIKVDGYTVDMSLDPYEGSGMKTDPLEFDQEKYPTERRKIALRALDTNRPNIYIEWELYSDKKGVKYPYKMDVWVASSRKNGFGGKFEYPNLNNGMQFKQNLGGVADAVLKANLGKMETGWAKEASKAVSGKSRSRVMEERFETKESDKN